MNAGVGIGLFICIVLIAFVGAVFKYDTDNDIEDLKSRVEDLKSRVEYFNMLYHNLDKRWGNMFDVMKGQQEEIKELKRMIEPKAEKKCCCGNCRFYHELNNQDSACLNVNVNNKLKGGSTIYSDNKPITWGAIKRVEPGGICEYYEPMEASDEHTN